MKKFLLPALSLLLLASTCKKNEDSTPATMQLSGTLSATNETGTVTSTGTGSVTGTYEPSTKVLTYKVTYSGITPTAGHFHTGAPGTDGPVIVIFTNVGTSPITGTATLTADQASALTAGNVYANLHTSANPNGELRANVAAK